MIRAQKTRSLYLLDGEEMLNRLQAEIPLERPLMAVDHQVLLDEYRHTSVGVFDVIGAAADFLVEHNRTGQLKQRIAAEEDALDARNREARRQSDIKLKEYAKQLAVQVDSWQKELDLQVQQLELEAEGFVRKTEQCRQIWQQNQFLRTLWVADRCHLNDVQEVLQAMDKLGIDQKEKHYMRLLEERVKLIRHLDKLSKCII